MLSPDDVQQLDALSADQALVYARQVIERLGKKLQFEQTKNAALAFELARLKQWRFGYSSESMDSAQSQLFETKELQVFAAESKAEDNAVDTARKLV